MMEKLFRNMTPWDAPQVPCSVVGDRRQRPISRIISDLLKALWGRCGATGMTSLYNNLDEGPTGFGESGT